MGESKDNSKNYKLFLDGVEIPVEIKEIKIGNAEPIEIPNGFNEITVTVKLNWIERLKWKFQLWKLFHWRRKENWHGHHNRTH